MGFVKGIELRFEDGNRLMEFRAVIDAAYEKRSVALTSNLHPAGLDTIMPKTLATAAVDLWSRRLVRYRIKG